MHKGPVVNQGNSCREKDYCIVKIGQAPDHSELLDSLEKEAGLS